MAPQVVEARARLQRLLNNTLMDTREDEDALRLILAELDRAEREYVAEADSLRDRALERTVRAQAAEAKLSTALDALETFAIMANADTAHLPDEHVVSLTYDDSALDAELGGPNTLLGERFMRAFRVAADVVGARS